MKAYYNRFIAILAAVIVALAAFAGDYVKVNGTHVRLRHSPSLQSKIYSNSNGYPIYPDKGDLLEYTGERGDFYQVRYQGRTLYISKQYSYVVSGSSSSRSSGQGRDRSWMYGNWRVRKVLPDGSAMVIEVSISPSQYVSKMNGDIMMSGSYSINGNTLRFLNTKNGHLTINWSNRRLITADGQRMTKY